MFHDAIPRFTRQVYPAAYCCHPQDCLTSKVNLSAGSNLEKKLNFTFVRVFATSDPTARTATTGGREDTEGDANRRSSYSRTVFRGKDTMGGRNWD
jgi:hypothetical protein